MVFKKFFQIFNFNFLMLLVLLTLLSACTENKAPQLRLGTNVWPGYEPLYLAREKGYLNEKMVHLVEYSNNSQVIQAYLNKLIDAAALTLDEVLLLLEQGEDPTIILVMDISNGADAVIGQPEIKSLNDLQGKKIGTEGNALGAYMLARTIELGGLEKKSITIAQTSIDEQEKAFLAKKIDAAVTFEPVLSKLINAGGKVLFDSRQLPGEIVDVLIVRKSFLEQHSQTITYLLSAWYQALLNIKEKPHETAAILGQRMNLNVEQTLSAYQGLILPDAEQNRQLLHNGSQPQLLTTANRLAKLMLEQGLLNKNVDPLILFSASE